MRCGLRPMNKIGARIDFELVEGVSGTPCRVKIPAFSYTKISLIVTKQKLLLTGEILL